MKQTSNNTLGFLIVTWCPMIIAHLAEDWWISIIHFGLSVVGAFGLAGSIIKGE